MLDEQIAEVAPAGDVVRLVSAQRQRSRATREDQQRRRDDGDEHRALGGKPDRGDARPLAHSTPPRSRRPATDRGSIRKPNEAAGRRSNISAGAANGSIPL